VLVALAYTGWCMLAWVVGDRHPLPVFDEVMRFAVLLGPVAFLGATIGLAYLALEPALRRRWPWRLTAWSRLLAGRWRDPLVGRDLLLGALAGVTLSALSLLDATLSVWLGLPPRLRESIGVQLAPPLPLLHSLLALNTVFFLPFLEMMFAFLMFLLLRREWLSWPAYVLLILGLNLSVAGAFGPSVGANVIHVLVLLGFFVIGTLTLARGGLLRFAALAGTLNLLGTAPLTTDASAWYAWQGWLAAGVVLAAAGYGFVTALGGQRLFREGFFGDA
jgi:serine/threonine-protein kinase